MSSQYSLSDEDLTEAIGKQMAVAGEDTTVKKIRIAVEKQLGVDLSDAKDRVKDIITQLLAEKDQPKQRKSAEKAPKRPREVLEPAPIQQEPDEDDEETLHIKALKKLGRAMNTGPLLVTGLKDLSKEEQVALLTERLRSRGAKFKGPVPTDAEIEAADKETRRKQDLDGLDPSLIMSSSKRRRVPDLLPNPRAEPHTGLTSSDSDSEEEDRPAAKGGASCAKEKSELELAGLESDEEELELNF